MLRCFASLLLPALCLSCGSVDSTSDLESRVSTLEVQVAELERLTTQGQSQDDDESSDSGAARILQEASDSTTTPPDQEISIEPLEGGVDLAGVASQAFAESDLFGAIDDDFGGTVVEGSSDEVTMRLVRAGLDDRPLLGGFIGALGFSDDTVQTISSTLGGEGVAESTDGAYTLTWSSGLEDLGVVIRRQ